eukprot:2306972-Prymnesium_polylepis.2
MLTKVAMITRACSESSLISKTHPTIVSLRHISSTSRAAPTRRLHRHRQEGGRCTQRGRDARVERVPTGPQQHGVEQGHPHWPHQEHRDGRVVGGLVLICIARERQVCSEVAPRLAVAVLDPLTRSVLKIRVDVLGRTRKVGPSMKGRTR